MDVGKLVVITDAFDVTFDEDVTRLFAGDNVDVVQRHFVRVPDHAAQLVAAHACKQNTSKVKLGYIIVRSKA